MNSAAAQTPQSGTVHFGTDPLWEQIKSKHSGPDWLLGMRKQAFENFRSAELPSRVGHLWRYTDPALFLTTNGLGGGQRTKDEGLLPTILQAEFSSGSLSAAASLRDGREMVASIDPKLASAGVRVIDLQEAARAFPDLLREHLGSLVGADFGKFEAYNTAAWSSGIVIYVPRGIEIEKPIHILSSASGLPYPLVQRLLVIVEDSASLTLIDEYGSGQSNGDGPSHSSAIVEMVLGAGARVKYAPVQNWGNNTISYLTQRARLHADTQMETVMTTLGGQVSKVDCGAILAGKGAESNMFGLAIGGARQQFDHHTVHDHRSGNTRSDLHFKVALRGRAHSAYTGLIRIEDHAQFCEAYQENRNLLLSSGAKAESIPELEILNNEVRCTHGATVGKVSPEEVFYLGARGIDPAEAVRLIVTGFVEPILKHIPDGVRERIHGEVLAHLGEIPNV
ncbi:MAG: Fe-S cluster assembly protein SufD [candidate division Zixibacteria bacterium]|nr:Fe-S cluster assembly protein SufD [candidate division Zixibacteria bacterium]